MKAATERKQIEAALLRSYHRLSLLADTVNKLLKSAAPQRVVEDICAKVVELLECDAFFNFILNEKEGRSN